jgi:hypothetical protein
MRDCPNGEDENICQPHQNCPKRDAFRCRSGICIDKKAVCDNFNDCIDGDDETDLLCKSFHCHGPHCNSSLLNCPPIKSKRLIVSCTHNGQNVSCGDDKILPETLAKYSCKKFYKPSNAYNSDAMCQKNGKWSSEILKCEAECGYLKDDVAVPLIVNGYRMSKIFPWHATMFIKRASHQYEFACGATLISESVVISAAHCFAGLNESDVRFALGKRYSNITIRPSDEAIAKVFSVKHIHRHPMYLDSLGNYGQDVALVELDGRIEINEDIHPICIDWEGIDGVAENQMGILVGMGVTENETFSEEIRVAQLSVVSTEECIRKQPRDFQKFITFTTFCAGLENGE